MRIMLKSILNPLDTNSDVPKSPRLGNTAPNPADRQSEQVIHRLDECRSRTGIQVHHDIILSNNADERFDGATAFDGRRNNSGNKRAE